MGDRATTLPEGSRGGRGVSSIDTHWLDMKSSEEEDNFDMYDLILVLTAVLMGKTYASDFG